MNTYVVVDIETTGGHPLKNDIIEIGAVFIEKGREKKRFNELIHPDEEISEYITSITGITNEMVASAPPISEVLPKFIDFCEDVPLIGHNINLFDYRMLKAKATQLKLPFEKRGLDTLIISRKMLAQLPSRRLGALCTYYHISLENAHRAYDDAYATYELFEHLRKDFEKMYPKLFEPAAFVWEMPKNVPMTTKQRAYLETLCRMHHLDLEIDWETMTKSECSKRIDYIINQYGRRPRH